MQRRRKIGLVAAGLVTSLLATLTGCGGESPLGDQVTLKVIAIEHGDRSGNSSKRFWDKLIGEFRFKHPDIDVDVNLYDRGEVDEKVRKMVEAGNFPDLAQTTGSFAGYAKKDMLYSAREVLSTTTQASIVESLALAGSVRRIQYGIPFTASTSAFFYNKELFTRAGIQEPPGTWEELQQAAVALEAIGVETPYGLPLGREQAQTEALNWMLSGDGGFVNDGGAYDFDSPQNIETFEWLRDELIGPGHTNSAPADAGRDEVYAGFVQGDVAMLNGHPGLMPLALENGVRFGTAPLPGKDGPTETTTGVADWTMAFKENGHAAQIRTFLDFAYQKKYVIEYADAHHMLPVTIDAANAMRENEDHKALWDFIDSLETARFHPIGKSTWPETVGRFTANVDDALAEDGDPGAVFGRVQRNATAAEAEAEATD